jgi:hypothetical protein
MKNCPMFSLCSNFLTSLHSVRGQFLTNDGEKSEKKQSLKSIEQGHTEGTFSLPFKILTLCLVGASPKPQEQKQKQKWHSLRSRLFKSKSSLKPMLYMGFNVLKAVIRGGNHQIVVTSLVDTR